MNIVKPALNKITVVLNVKQNMKEEDVNVFLFVKIQTALTVAAQICVMIV